MFNDRPEKIKRDHVENQVHMILVYESGCYKPVVLSSRFYLVRIHHKFAPHSRFVESYHADENGNAYQEISDIHVLTFYVKKNN